MFFLSKETVTVKLSIFPPTTFIKCTALIRILIFFPPTTLIRSPFLLGTQEYHKPVQAAASDSSKSPVRTAKSNF